MKLFSRSTVIAAATTAALAASSLTAPAWADEKAPASTEISGSTATGSSEAGSGKTGDDSATTEGDDSDTEDKDTTTKDSDPVATAVEGSSDNPLSSGIGSSEETVYKNLDGEEVTGPKIAMVLTKLMRLVKAVVGIVSLVSAAASLAEIAKKYMPR
ncbi:hypothetical protein [Corynebacterium pygosceleis]|uniref:Secreted protein n=1 Tax=Corynebacterium pygosceleis TaxID=2800406 RepID=A0A9Q4GHT0_9CORY|nr:hypothetical protein [Corynebacterium pygosceleis]MCK7636935.1 hypothetical protein [Corynebacterium pygosceleis]MCK7674409.1 hypothetical protein [Corynebacterium pygosceleis]MCL0120293.1 hypothetical protein [Corynebacterium pygosceleis]MCX7443840.1 hypothetical protein [Corynebacterium pygosceleis]MCX7467688.1 hypothetical protein [Corynebacterium pygosceleis]